MTSSPFKNKMEKQFSKRLFFLLFVLLLPAFCNAADVIKKDLGVHNASFGASGQAKELLSLIKAHPHERQYQISYKTETDTVFFSCDIAMDTITRIHKLRNGTGTVEVWQGDAQYRLQAAAKGGSLNDTQKGKSAGKMTSFKK